MPFNALSSMPMILGNRPAIDNDGFITDLAFKRRTVDVTATTRTVLIEDSGTYFTTYGATGSCIFTLPDVILAKGCEYWFADAAEIGVSSDVMTVTSTPIDVMTSDGDIDADSVTFGTASKMVGNTFHVFSNGTLWITSVEGKIVTGGVIVTVAS